MHLRFFQSSSSSSSRRIIQRRVLSSSSSSSSNRTHHRYNFKKWWKISAATAAATTSYFVSRDFVLLKPIHPEPWNPLFVSHKTSLMRLDDDETIYDYYEFGDVLGEGGFSVVYEGKCLETKASVAIKVVDKENSNLADVKNEIAIMVKTGIHPNIVSLRAAYDTKKAYILILDLVRGGEVFEHVVSKGTLSEKYACMLFKAVASAVEHMHKHGIVHNDLKPENLLLTNADDDALLFLQIEGNEDKIERSGLLKVADFGESYFMDSYIDDDEEDDIFPVEDQDNNETNETSFSMRQFRTRRPKFRGGGTPAYMSPERVRRDGYSSADDMWAMGVCLFIMLCGSHPFDPNGSRSAINIADEIERGMCFFSSSCLFFCLSLSISHTTHTHTQAITTRTILSGQHSPPQLVIL